MKPSREHGPENSKKPYNSPKLEIYGDLKSITRAVAPTGPKNDGGSGKDKSGA